MSHFDKNAATELLESAFASWIKDLSISVRSIGTDSAVLCMPFSEKLCRDNGVICGQAIMSLADTAMVFAISAAASGYLPMTTVDQTIHFLKPAAGVDLLAEARVVRLGRTMAFGSVAIISEKDSKTVAMAQTAYALMRENK